MNASEYLASLGVSRFSLERFSLFSRPFDAVKVKGRDFDKAMAVLGGNDFHVFALEGGKFIYTTKFSNRLKDGLPRFIWMDIDNGVKAGWARSRMVQRAWDKFKLMRGGDLSKESLQGVI